MLLRILKASLGALGNVLADKGTRTSQERKVINAGEETIRGKQDI